jgi:WD40 repeat protein
VSDIAALTDARRALISFSGPTYVWDLDANRELFRAPGAGMSISVTKDGQRAIVGGGKDAWVWDLLTCGIVAQEAHQKSVQRVAFSSDDRRAIALTDEGIRVSALPPGRSDSERSVVVAAKQFFPDDWQIRDYRHDFVAVSPFNAQLIVTSGHPGDGGARLWERATGNFRQPPGRNFRAGQAVAFSPRDPNLLLVGSDDGIVRLYDLDTGEHRELVGHEASHGISGVAFSSDGRLGYSACGSRANGQPGIDFAVRVWDLGSCQVVARFEGHAAAIESIAVANDGRRLLSGGSDGLVILWDTRTRRPIHRLPGHGRRVTSVAFLNNGPRAVSASEDDTVRLWDTETGREILNHFKGSTNDNTYLAVAPDGKRMFSAGRNHTRYWNLETGELIQTLKWEQWPLRGAFTPDGRYVIWGGWANILRMYELTDIQPPQSAAPRRGGGSKN